uniref:Carbonic anhydrase n=1 Tax=Takifugu rubripes TaxID=31033 RepID=A0A674P2L8_TAKRU
MVLLPARVGALAAGLCRGLARTSHRISAVRRCNLAACSSKYVLSQIHPMWQQPIAVPGGHCQSPIDIVVRKSVFDSALKPLATDYDPETCQQIWNNGYSFLVEYDDSADKSTLKGGPLQDQFRLCQFHFHWGESNAWGSEHTVDRRLFPAELHLVHWNSDKYSLFEEAVSGDNGLAVIGVFLKVLSRPRSAGLERSTLNNPDSCCPAGVGGKETRRAAEAGRRPACYQTQGQRGGVHPVRPRLSSSVQHRGLLDVPRLSDHPPADRVGHLDRHEAAHRSQPRPAGRLPQPPLHLRRGGSSEEHGEQLPRAAASVRPDRPLLLHLLSAGGGISGRQQAASLTLLHHTHTHTDAHTHTRAHTCSQRS